MKNFQYKLRRKISVLTVLATIFCTNSLVAQSTDESKLYASKTVFNDVSKISSTDPLTSILQKYKGKVVYVDVWATWCLPCLFEMPNSRKLREKISDTNVVFVYICINSPDEKRWRKLITSKRMEGENYFLSAQQSAALLQKYNIKGIPRYMLYDQDGDAISEDAKRPGEPVVFKTIKSMINNP